MSKRKQESMHSHAPNWELFLSQWSMAASHPEQPPSSSLLYRLRNTCTTIAAMPYKHYFMKSASLAAFPSAEPCCSFAHLTELFGKAQQMINLPSSLQGKHGVMEVLAFSLTLKGQHLGYQSRPFAWPSVQFAFSGAQLNLSINQQGLVKSSRRERERELESTDESVPWELLN